VCLLRARVEPLRAPRVADVLVLSGRARPMGRRTVTGSLLPIPDDRRIASLLADWPEPFQTDAVAAGHYYPRALWLTLFEWVLREHYPSANSDSLTLTARHHAPFPLAAGHDVP
jgi:hypothetical protein